MNAAAAVFVASIVGVSASQADIRGDWINERGSVVVHISDCTTGLCGTVIWSSPAAKRDAARGGTADFDGTTVMTGFAPVSDLRWQGKLFVPDQGRRVRATVTLVDRGALAVKACDLGGLICSKQTWTRWRAN